MYIIRIFKHFNINKCLEFPFGSLKGNSFEQAFVFYKSVIKLRIFDCRGTYECMTSYWQFEQNTNISILTKYKCTLWNCKQIWYNITDGFKTIKRCESKIHLEYNILAFDDVNSLPIGALKFVILKKSSNILALYLNVCKQPSSLPSWEKPQQNYILTRDLLIYSDLIMG